MIQPEVKQNEWHPFNAVVKCRTHGLVSLTEKEHEKQFALADAEWYCPICGFACHWCDNSLLTYPAPVPAGMRLIPEFRAIPSIVDEENCDRAYDFDKNAEDVARSRDQYVVWPEKNQLQLDIDSEAQYEEFQERACSLDMMTVNSKEVFEKMTTDGHGKRLALVTETPSKTPGHKHITLTFNREFTEAERICYQFALGSDYVREMLNAFRLFRKVPNPTRLFENMTPEMLADRDRENAAKDQEFEDICNGIPTKAAVIPTTDDFLSWCHDIDPQP